LKCYSNKYLDSEMTKQLTNRKVVIFENDFVDRNIVASIVDVAEDYKAMLLKIVEQFEADMRHYKYVVVNSRLENESFKSLELNKISGCSATWVSEQNYNPQNPFDTSWWRGGAGAITSLKLL